MKSAKYVGLYLSQICNQLVFNEFYVFLRGKGNREIGNFMELLAEWIWIAYSGKILFFFS